MKDEHIRPLSSKEAKKFTAGFSTAFGKDLVEFFGVKPRIEFIETGDGNIYVVDGRPVLVQVNGRLIPSLVFNEFIDSLPLVLVDRGAIPYVCNGADVMAPGITAVNGSFEEGAQIVVRDSEHRKALAVGSALFSDKEIRGMKKGKTIKNLHFVGDPLWGRIKEKIGNQVKLKS